MISFEIEYINNTSFASSPSDPKKSEWPPHPDRLFSAIVASWGISKNKDEIDVLHWLELQKPPDITFPDTGCRDSFTNFVPVSSNAVKIEDYLGKMPKKDKTKPKKISNTNQVTQKEKEYVGVDLTEILKGIKRKPRFFPATTLPNNNPIIHMVWKEAQPTKKILDVLTRLVKQIPCLGHSASL